GELDERVGVRGEVHARDLTLQGEGQGERRLAGSRPGRDEDQLRSVELGPGGGQRLERDRERLTGRSSDLQALKKCVHLPPQHSSQIAAPPEMTWLVCRLHLVQYATIRSPSPKPRIHPPHPAIQQA